MLEKIHATTILAVRHQGKLALGGAGQVTLGNIVMKQDAQKIDSDYVKNRLKDVLQRDDFARFIL